jgi:hypothetical protein
LPEKPTNRLDDALITVDDEINATPELTKATKSRALNYYYDLVRVLSETGQPPEFPAEQLVPRAAERLSQLN